MIFSPGKISFKIPGSMADGNYMNRRDRLRFSTDMIATVTGIDEPEISCKGRLANVSAHGLSLILSDSIPSGIAVKVQWGTSLVIGQLLYCELYKDEYRAGVQVQDPIYDSAHTLKKDQTLDFTDFEVSGE